MVRATVDWSKVVDVVAVVVGRDIDMGGGNNGGGDDARIDIVDVLFFLPSISLSVMFFCCCCTDEENFFLSRKTNAKYTKMEHWHLFID